MEHTHYPAMAHMQLAEKMLDYKPCTIHGNHPHVLQGIQRKENGIIAYSIGNCLFDDAVSLNQKIIVHQFEENKESMLAGICLKENKVCDFSIKGIKEENGYITESSIVKEKIKMYSDLLQHVENIKEYEQMRTAGFRKSIEDKFGKRRNLKWIMSRFTYYSVGARILRIKNEWKYKAYFG